MQPRWPSPPAWPTKPRVRLIACQIMGALARVWQLLLPKLTLGKQRLKGCGTFAPHSKLKGHRHANTFTITGPGGVERFAYPRHAPRRGERKFARTRKRYIGDDTPPTSLGLGVDPRPYHHRFQPV